jgi:hypothetical protein
LSQIPVGRVGGVGRALVPVRVAQKEGRECAVGLVGRNLSCAK